MSSEKEDKVDVVLDKHATNDRLPVYERTSGVIPDDRQNYLERLSNYTLDWCESYRMLINKNPEVLWTDVTNDFSEAVLLNMRNPLLLMVRDTLMKNGFYVESRRGLKRYDALVNCLKADECPLIATKQNATHQESEVEPQTEILQSQIEEQSAEQPMEGIRGHDSYQPDVVGGPQTHCETSEDNYNDRKSSSYALQSLYKVFQGRKKFSGRFDEDLLGTSFRGNTSRVQST
ncbi:hypothetical protein BWQ96_04907 [Gracilariopsis chorda]|uniref:Uncharacterized protein n=1 Tax=Gracilariopsis chorda TaxID=448386 RepID=A0A2V3IUC5_9FLOR|nr:hypothetical protein BWQ96_04907 [Gracilariopsis chorda]|eukprot:PXF45317.1 hypothetical protein BWQ96_04907 [Gracilariopsis chorda]